MSTPGPASPSAVPDWTLADRLRKARTEAGFEQEELADQTGISRKSISSYENGHTEPSRPNLVAIATATGVPLDWLAAGEDPTRRGGRRRRPRGRRTAALIPVAIVAAGYLSLFRG